MMCECTEVPRVKPAVGGLFRRFVGLFVGDSADRFHSPLRSAGYPYALSSRFPTAPVSSSSPSPSSSAASWVSLNALAPARPPSPSPSTRSFPFVSQPNTPQRISSRLKSSIPAVSSSRPSTLPPSTLCALSLSSVCSSATCSPCASTASSTPCSTPSTPCTAASTPRSHSTLASSPSVLPASKPIPASAPPSVPSTLSSPCSHPSHRSGYSSPLEPPPSPTAGPEQFAHKRTPSEYKLVKTAGRFQVHEMKLEKPTKKKFELEIHEHPADRRPTWPLSQSLQSSICDSPLSECSHLSRSLAAATTDLDRSDDLLRSSEPYGGSGDHHHNHNYHHNHHNHHPNHPNTVPKINTWDSAYYRSHRESAGFLPDSLPSNEPGSRRSLSHSVSQPDMVALDPSPSSSPCSSVHSTFSPSHHRQLLDEPEPPSLGSQRARFTLTHEEDSSVATTPTGSPRGTLSTPGVSEVSPVTEVKKVVAKSGRKFMLETLST
ncbi:uncharacterized protein BJ171DRAFT_307275 [Polychytrium aggregatum]|uniref:uncharacterized protein n=1 Tax=Polychytrium aggregatum TaxID=110093 RepID=UPI0022FF3642|nr:uncharacterized protein BJ171DRAFT_307275 [Polychytrium aggregatum]KAI9206815.1 hypothetical protein BJ171DRAFT_307275 [Polychytrium aggregatum]